MRRFASGGIPLAAAPAPVRRPSARRAAVGAVLAVLALLPPDAAADDADRPRLSFGAFGTLGLVYSTEKQADFVSNSFRPDGPGRSESVSAGPDSVLAGQLTFETTPKLTAVVQVVAEQTADDDYVPEVEWANLSYAFTPDFSVRVGRVVLPAFLVSQHRKVSYALPWIRPPVELYDLNPVSRIDGVDASYRLRMGNWTETLNANFGRTEVDFPRGFGSVVADDAWNLNATFERGVFTGRFAVAGARLDIDALDPLFDGLRAFGPQGQALADRFDIDDTSFHFASAGMEYDPGRWFVMAEAGWLDTNSGFGERLGGYVTWGWRRGPLTPYVTYSRVELLSESSVAGLSLDGLPPELVPVAAGLNAGLNDLLRAAPAQQNLSFGGRWDFRTGMALKLQVDLIDQLDGSTGTFANASPRFEPGGRTQLVSLATVFVF